MAIGYYQNGSIAPLYDTGFDSPNGQMYSSVRDLSQFLSLMFRDQVAFGENPKQILDGTTIRELCLPVFVNDDGKTGWGAAGWEMIHLNGHWARTKTGHIDGYSAFIMFVPKIKLGIVALLSLDSVDVTNLVMNPMYRLIDAFTFALQSLQPTPPLPPNYQV